MSGKILVWVVLGGLLVGFGLFMAGRLTVAKPDASSPTIVWAPDESQWSEESKKQVKDVIARRQKLIDEINKADTSNGLSDDAVDKIASLHGSNGLFIEDDGEIHHGQGGGIRAHLQAEKEKIKQIKIRLRTIYAKEHTEVLNSGHPSDQDIVHTLTFVFSNTYTRNGKPVDPFSTASCRHARMCTCDEL